MNMEYKKSGQIPVFGDWDNANEMPITQYFECARQAGLVPYSSSSGEHGPQSTYGHGYGGGGGGGGDLYGVDYWKRSHAPQRKINKRRPDAVKERSRQVKVHDAKDHLKYHNPLSQKQFQGQTNNNKSANLVAHHPTAKAKPVDEDLYKIPADLLRESKQKRRVGFLSRCFLPPCNKT